MGVMSAALSTVFPLPADIPTEGCCETQPSKKALHQLHGEASGQKTSLENVPRTWDTSVQTPQTTAASEILAKVLL